MEELAARILCQSQSVPSDRVWKTDIHVQQEKERHMSFVSSPFILSLINVYIHFNSVSLSVPPLVIHQTGHSEQPVSV
jgi:hypothetical protein